MRKSRSNSDRASSHVTPIGGNIFLDIGFSPSEAGEMLAETERIIEEKLRRKRPTQKVISVDVRVAEFRFFRLFNALRRGALDEVIVTRNGRAICSMSRV